MKIINAILHPSGLSKIILKKPSKTFDAIFLCLILLIVLIFLATSYNYKHNSHAIHTLSEELIHQVNRRIIAKTSNYFFDSINMTALSSKVSGSGIKNIKNNLVLEKLMLAILETHPNLKMFNVGNEKGDFLMQRKIGNGKFQTKKIYHKNGIRSTTIIDWNINHKAISRRTYRDAYDPRTKVWYQGAKKDKRTHWSHVYIFHSGDIPGVTVSHPVIVDGVFQGVFSLDIPLEEISDYLVEVVKDLKKRKKITHATAFIVNERGELIAYPYHDHSEATVHKGDHLEVTKIENLPDPVVRLSYRTHLKDKSRIITNQVGEHTYVSSYEEFYSKKFNEHWQVGLIVREDDFVAEVKETNRTILFFSIGVILFVFSLGIVLNIMKKELKKRNDFIQATFGRYLSNEIVENILDSPDGTNLGGEKREVTVLMTDLRGFTSISEKLPAETCVKMINIYLDAMTDIIFNHQGTIDEFIGDAILTIFGAPEKRENDAERAVACAIEMQLAMEEVNRKNREHGFPEVHMGIGINTGELVVGNIGSSKRTKYGVVGSNVNLASRIESYTIGGQILISESTKNACGDLLRIDSQMRVKPKGVKEHITIYEVGGIGGEYDTEMPRRVVFPLDPLSNPLQVEFTILSGKHAGEEWHPGRFLSYNQREADLESAIALHHLDNIQLRTVDSSGKIPHLEEIYAKVVQEKDGMSRIHITAAPVDMNDFVKTYGSTKQDLLSSVITTLPME
ncbi:MAG: adenylate/guanylate cyclase domain-containing protein [Spirochaetota bacterium]